MDYSGIGKVLVNSALSFAAGYGAAMASGLDPKQCLAAGLIVLGSNQAGLHQIAPFIGNKPPVALEKK